MDTRKLATRFAAKEATMKAIGRADKPVPWRSIEVLARHGRCAVAIVIGETA